MSTGTIPDNLTLDTVPGAMLYSNKSSYDYILQININTAEAKSNSIVEKTK